MELLETLSPTALMVILSASIIILIVLFTKVLKWVLKLAIIAVMLVCIAYFLQQAGIIQIPGIGN